MRKNIYIETTDKKVHNLQLTRIGWKREREMEVIDFISVCRQQKFKEKAKINPIEIKIGNYKIQNIFGKYKNYMATLMPEGLLFSSSIKNNAEKIFLTTNSLIDAKYSLKNRTLYQVIENKSKRNQTLK